MPARWAIISRMAMIEARDIRKTFSVSAKEPGLINSMRHFFRRKKRVVEAVKGFSFAVEPGEIVGFLGPNGAGKTTTLKMLTGLIHPTSGEARVAGFVPYRRQREFQRRISLVMGNKQQLIWDLPAMESLRINAAVYDIPDAVFKQRVEELRTLLGIDKQLFQPVRKLSLGERMKAELLAALLHQPEVLFLDEPTLCLDVNAQAAVRGFLREYNRAHGATILLTSHYMADITALCKRVILIHEGQLFYDGTLDGIVSRFAPYREVVIELGAPQDEAKLRQYGEMEAMEGQSARIIVRREMLTQTVSRILSELPVLDLTVTDPPIEKIIGELFTAGTTGKNEQPATAAAAAGGYGGGTTGGEK